jgi:hypothetical protein
MCYNIYGKISGVGFLGYPNRVSSAEGRKANVFCSSI